MHDPDVVAFSIRCPWPQRSSWRRPSAASRWRVKYGPFWRLAGHEFYFPELLVMWHVEPGGHDSGEVCKHYRRWQRQDGTWDTKVLNGWRFHVNHWRLQCPPLQGLRRRLLTRCEWCAGRSRKGDAVNFSLSWDRVRSPWWRGERDLFHEDCSGIWQAHRACVCDDPILDHEGYGTCARCGKFRRFGATDRERERHRELAAIPAGQRGTTA